MTPVWQLLVLAFAAWRSWALVSRDSILDPIRDSIAPSGGYVRDFLECPYCAGFWSAGAWVTAWDLWGPGDPPGIVSWQAGWWAVAALVVVIELAVDRLAGSGE